MDRDIGRYNKKNENGNSTCDTLREATDVIPNKRQGMDG